MTTGFIGDREIDYENLSPDECGEFVTIATGILSFPSIASRIDSQIAVDQRNLLKDFSTYPIPE